MYSDFINSTGSVLKLYRSADKSLARPRKKQATATDDFELHVSYL
jgi:hypothetical protein